MPVSRIAMGDVTFATAAELAMHTAPSLVVLWPVSRLKMPEKLFVPVSSSVP